MPPPSPTSHPTPTPATHLCSVATEAGMYAIRARRKTVTEKDFLDAVNKVRTVFLRLLVVMARGHGTGLLWRQV